MFQNDLNFSFEAPSICIRSSDISSVTAVVSFSLTLLYNQANWLIKALRFSFGMCQLHPWILSMPV